MPTERQSIMSDKVICQEIEIDVPYGKLCAKKWGEDKEGCKRVLALHGLADNCATYDFLAPHLIRDANVCLVALDLPGQGKSSKFPPGASYTDMTTITDIRRVIKALNWCGSDRKFSIIGHSYGGLAGMYYSSVFYSEVDEVIGLDFIKSNSMTAQKAQQLAARTLDKFIDVVPSQSLVSANSYSLNKPVKKDEQVVMTRDEAIATFIESRKKHTTLTREEALCFIDRSTTKVESSPDKVIINEDQRVQAFVNLREIFEVNQVAFWNIKCHIFCILGNKGIYTINETFGDKLDEMQEFMRTKARSFHLQWVEGDHYLHMRRADEIAKIITSYWKSPGNYKVSA